MRDTYAAFRADRLAGITPGLGTLYALPLTEGYAFDEAHTSIDDIPEAARLGDPVELTNVTTTDGHLNFDNPTFTFAPDCPVVLAIVVYSDDWLVYYTDEDHGLPLSPPAAGTTRAWKIPSKGLFRL